MVKRELWTRRLLHWRAFVQLRRGRRGDRNLRWPVGPHAPSRPIDWAREVWGEECGCMFCLTLGVVGAAETACAALASLPEHDQASSAAPSLLPHMASPWWWAGLPR